MAKRNNLGKYAIIFSNLSQNLFWKNFHWNRWDCSQSRALQHTYKRRNAARNLEAFSYSVIPKLQYGQDGHFSFQAHSLECCSRSVFPAEMGSPVSGTSIWLSTSKSTVGHTAQAMAPSIWEFVTHHIPAEIVPPSLFPSTSSDLPSLLAEPPSSCRFYSMSEVVGVNRKGNLDQQNICPCTEPGQLCWKSPVWDSAEGIFKASFPICQQLWGGEIHSPIPS